MSAGIIVDQVMTTLGTQKGRLSCSEVKGLPESLGFSVKDAKRGGHKVFTHSGLPDFHSASLNCGHGRGPEVKPSYIKNIMNIIDANQKNIIMFLEKSEAIK
jgi:hypothetical protein